MNLILDGIFSQILMLPAGWAFGAIYAASLQREVVESDLDALQVWGFVLGIILSFFYFFISESLWGRTPAKFITKTMVVRAGGGPLTTSQVLGRTAARFIPLEAFSFIFSHHPVGWHDSLSATRVVRVR